MSVSDGVIRRLRSNNISFKANDNIAEHLSRHEIDGIRSEVEKKMEAVLRSMIIDVDNDHNSKGTAKRFAKMMMDEIASGRYVDPPTLTDFPNHKHLDEMYTVGPIAVRSMCSHHLLPVVGEAYIGVVPSERVIGLSKFSRIVEWIMARPQIQEEATVMIADELERIIKPKGLAVFIRASHHCMITRGVRDKESVMTTSVLRGIIMHSASARAEFYSTIKGK